MILLDTNALLWLESGHRRARALAGLARLYVSPATMLEVQMLIEVGRLRARPGVTLAQVAADERWIVDDLASARWFTAAADLAWTLDPFDRLIVAHARVRGWKLATGDKWLLTRLGPSEVVAL